MKDYFTRKTSMSCTSIRVTIAKKIIDYVDVDRDDIEHAHMHTYANVDNDDIEDTDIVLRLSDSDSNEGDKV